MEKLDSKNAKAWEELMVDYLYDLDDWNEARCNYCSYLKTIREMPLKSDLRSYLSCCAESAGSVHPIPDLKETVEEFYSRFGMENSKKGLRGAQDNEHAIKAFSRILNFSVCI